MKNSKWRIIQQTIGDTHVYRLQRRFLWRWWRDIGSPWTNRESAEFRLLWGNAKIGTITVIWP